MSRACRKAAAERAQANAAAELHTARLYDGIISREERIVFQAGRLLGFTPAARQRRGM